MSDIGFANGVRSILRIDSLELTDTEINQYLVRARRTLQSDFKSVWNRDMLYAITNRKTGNVVKTYESYLTMNASTDFAVKVYVNGIALTLTTEYTVDRANSSITIISDLLPGEKIVIEYTPDIATDYVEYLSAVMIVEGTNLNVENGNNQVTIIDKYNERLWAIKNQFNQKPRIFGYTENGSI